MQKEWIFPENERIERVRISYYPVREKRYLGHEAVENSFG